MGNRKHRRKFRRTATQMTVSVATVAMVLTGAAVSPASPGTSPEVKLSADATALILCGTTCPTPNAYWIEHIRDQFVAPTHPDQDLDYVGVTAPMEFWPITGIFRLLGLALGPASLWGPGGPGWPDEPWWKLSGLFDLTADESLAGGVADLEAAMAENGNDNLVIYGNSQGAGVANVVKKKLAEQYPTKATAPDIDFVLGGDPNLPNGGLMSRFPGLYVPILNLTFNGPAATDAPFKTVEINRQYDGFSDFPLYPMNLLADLNAIMGIVYVHMYGMDVSLVPGSTTPAPTVDQHGDTTYYYFENENLPLFGPLRNLGVPEALIDIVEPFFRVLVELGYDRTIPAWEPTPARFTAPPVDLLKLAGDLIGAIGEGINNALAIVGLAPAPGTAKKESAPLTAGDTTTQSDEKAPTVAVTGARQIFTETATLTTADTESAEPGDSPEMVAGESEPDTQLSTPAEDVTENAPTAEPTAEPTSGESPVASTPEPQASDDTDKSELPDSLDDTDETRESPGQSSQRSPAAAAMEAAVTGAESASGEPSSAPSSPDRPSAGADGSDGGGS